MSPPIPPPPHHKSIMGHPWCLFQYLSGYFDTTTGPKREKESYAKIAESVATKPQDMMFLTDISAGW